MAVNSNTHTGPDYRLPPCAATHDASCNDPACQDALNAASGQEQRKALIRLCKAAQRAARQTAGYFFGYTFKGQPVGRRALQLISQSFDYLSRSLQMQPEHRRFQRTATRTMVDFHHSTTSRPTTEETLLSLYALDSDATNAEFIRLYQSIEFNERGNAVAVETVS